MADITEAGTSITVTNPTATEPAPQEDEERQEHNTIHSSDNQNGHTGNIDLGIPGVGKNPYYKGLSLADIGVRDPSTLISTPFGKARRLEFLSFKDKVFLVLVGLSVPAVLVFTIWRLVTIDTGSADFTMCIVILLNTIFFLYYVLSGTFYERPYEIAIVVVSALVIWTYLVINYALSDAGIYKMIRLIVASVFSPFIMITGVMMIRSYLITNSVVFRTVGANKLAQERVKTLYQYLALIKADLQIALTMALLILRDGSNLNLEDKILLPVVLVYSISSCAVGYLMVSTDIAGT